MKLYKCSHCDQKFEADSSSSAVTIPCPHCGQFLVLPSTELATGTTLGGFEIVKKIGEGGMGNVYLAIQKSIGRRVALKVLSKEFSSDKDIIQQFKKEVQLSGKLNHPNIVRAIDAGEEGEYYYLAINFIDGEDGEKILSREKLIPEDKALEIIIKVAEMLQYAWEKHNLIHRDVKPGNIMIDSKGAPFLMDLGIAQSFDFKRKDIKEEVLGSPFYMSPEQAQGLQLDWRTDLYSLGATLYHMAVGAPPFDAKEVNTIVEMHISAPFPDPKKRNPNSNLSPLTVNLLKKMLAKKPEDRFRSWQEFITEANKVLTQLRKPAKENQKKLSISNVKPLPSSVNSKANFLSHLYFFAFLIIIVMAILISYRLYTNLKNNKALDSLKRAENYLVKSRNDYEGALPLFQYAVTSSIGTKHYNTAVQRLNEIKELAQMQEEKIKYFDKKFQEANAKMKEKEYQQALEILEQIKDIHDEARRKNAYIAIEIIKKTIEQQH